MYGTQLAAFGEVTVSGDRDLENSRTGSSNTTPGAGIQKGQGEFGELKLLNPSPLTDRLGSGAGTGIVISQVNVSMSGTTSELKGSSPSP